MKMKIIAIGLTLGMLASCGNGGESSDYPESYGLYLADGRDFVVAPAVEFVEEVKNLGKPTTGELGHSNAMQALSDPRFGKNHIIKAHYFERASATDIGSNELTLVSVNDKRPTISIDTLNEDSGRLAWRISDSWKRGFKTLDTVDSSAIVISGPKEGVFKYVVTLPKPGCFVVRYNDGQSDTTYPVCTKG